MGYLDSFKEGPRYYPGSSRQLDAPREVPKKEVLWDSNPRIYKVNGVDTEFFLTGHLAAALGRKPVTIRKWEREGIIPKAPKFVQGTGGDARGKRRLYTRAHVEGMVEIARDEGLLKGDQRAVTTTRFTERVIQLFKELRSQ